MVTGLKNYRAKIPRYLVKRNISPLHQVLPSTSIKTTLKPNITAFSYEDFTCFSVRNAVVTLSTIYLIIINYYVYSDSHKHCSFHLTAVASIHFNNSEKLLLLFCERRFYRCPQLKEKRMQRAATNYHTNTWKCPEIRTQK